jgi:hypothetical protein
MTKKRTDQRLETDRAADLGKLALGLAIGGLLVGPGEQLRAALPELKRANAGWGEQQRYAKTPRHNACSISSMAHSSSSGPS